MLLKQFIAGACLIATTVTLHGLVQQYLITFLERVTPWIAKLSGHLWKVPTCVVAVYGVMAAIIIDIWVWALFFYSTGEPGLHSIEAALYFSTSTFTTVGFGDVTLSPEWRLLGSFEAANGMLLFGWSTAFIFEIISNIYRSDRIEP